MDYFIFICFIFYIQIFRIFSISLKYPFSIYLSNGNILSIYEQGISIYDHLFTKKIKDVKYFPYNEVITRDDISRITIVLEDSYIFSIIKDRIYIFNDKGGLLFHNNTLIIKDDNNPLYYSLSIIKKETTLYNYIISFFVNQTLYNYLFQYNISSNENYLIDYKEISSITYKSFTFYVGDDPIYTPNFNRNFDKNSPLSCQFLFDILDNIIYSCFFSTDNKFCFAFYNTTESFLSFDTAFALKSVSEIECIKSIANYNHSKALISLYSSSGILKSFIYEISNLDNITFNGNFISYQCKRNYFGLNAYYYRQNEEFVNSCIDLSGNLLVEFYNKDYNIYDYYIVAKTINNNIYSILYSNCTKKYFLISEKHSFVLLDGDKEELEEIKKNFNIENCINIEEDEKQEISYNQNSYEDLIENDDNNPIIMKYIYQNSVNNFLNDLQKGMFNSEIDDLMNKEYETEDYIEKDNSIIMQITTPYNQINKIYENISTIYIEEKCQEILKEKYNLTKKNY